MNLIEKKLRKKGLRFLVVLAVTFLFIFTLELSLRGMGRFRPRPERWFKKRSEVSFSGTTAAEAPSPEYVKSHIDVRYVSGLADPDLLFKLNANVTAPHIQKVNGEIIFETTTSYDKNGMRRTTGGLTHPSKARFAAFWGGSRLFGWGVRDDQTIPSFYQKYNPSRGVYNFGLPGHSPQFFLKALKKKKLDELVEKEGTFYYEFDPGFEYRTVGGSQHIWVFRSTYYELDDQNNLVEYPDYATPHPALDFIYKGIARSAIFQNLNLNLPFYLSDRACLQIATIFSESEKVIKEKYANTELKIVFFLTDQNTRLILSCLKRKGLKAMTLNRAIVPELLNKSNFYPDWHPKAILYELFAKKLTEYESKVNSPSSSGPPIFFEN